MDELTNRRIDEMMNPSYDCFLIQKITIIG